MPNIRINYIELPAGDIELAKEFYGNTFGWTFQDFGPNYCAFNDGETDGGFYKSDLSSNYAEGSALVVLYTKNLEATLESIIENGGRVVKDIFSFPGGRRFHFADPNGNELAVWSDK